MRGDPAGFFRIHNAVRRDIGTERHISLFADPLQIRQQVRQPRIQRGLTAAMKNSRKSFPFFPAVPGHLPGSGHDQLFGEPDAFLMGGFGKAIGTVQIAVQRRIQRQAGRTVIVRIPHPPPNLLRRDRRLHQIVRRHILTEGKLPG